MNSVQEQRPTPAARRGGQTRAEITLPGRRLAGCTCNSKPSRSAKYGRLSSPGYTSWPLVRSTVAPSVERSIATPLATACLRPRGPPTIPPTPAPIATFVASCFVLARASMTTASGVSTCRLPRNSISRNSLDIYARPLTPPGGRASITLPTTARPTDATPPKSDSSSIRWPWNRSPDLLRLDAIDWEYRPCYPQVKGGRGLFGKVRLDFWTSTSHWQSSCSTVSSN